MFRKIAHIGVAVNDLESAVELFKKLFGKPPTDFEEVRDQKVKTAMFHFQDCAIELLQATSPDSSIAKFIEKRGEGVHHVSFIVENISQELERLRTLGFQLVDERPRPGAGGYDVAFVHPKSTNSVLIEISQQRLPALPTGRQAAGR